MEKICIAVPVRPPVPHNSSNGTLWKVDYNRISLHEPTASRSPVSLTLSIMCSMKVVRILGFMSYSPRTLFMPQSKDSMELRLLNGRTSSGKTFTIFGSETDPGIIHQAVRDVFDRIQMRGIFVAGLREEIVSNAEQVLKLIESWRRFAL